MHHDNNQLGDSLGAVTSGSTRGGATTPSRVNISEVVLSKKRSSSVGRGGVLRLDARDGCGMNQVMRSFIAFQNPLLLLIGSIAALLLRRKSNALDKSYLSAAISFSK